MNIPTPTVGGGLRHPVCSWFCTQDVHAITMLGPLDSSAAEAQDMAQRLGLEVVEVFVAREADIDTFLASKSMKEFNGKRVRQRTQASQGSNKPWIIRCRVREDV